MTNSIRQHRPAYFTGYPEPLTVEFETIEQLTKIPFVANFARDLGDGPFWRYSLGDDMLMAEYREGATWWVVGYIKDRDAIADQLPRWIAGGAGRWNAAVPGDEKNPHTAQCENGSH